MKTLEVIESVLDNAQMLDLRGVSKCARHMIAYKINEVLFGSPNFTRALARIECEEAYKEE